MAVQRCLFVLVALALSVACSQTARPQTKENKKMDGLTIGTFPQIRAVLPGESFPVVSTFENHSAAPIQLPSSEGPSPLAYELLTEKDRSVRYEVSQDLRDMRRTTDIPPPRIFPPQTVEPAHSMQRQEDLAELHNQDFAPGKYLIRTRYPFEGPPEVVSALSPFTVLAPHIESFSSAVCGNRHVLVTAYAHRREDGGVLLMQREAYADPREGVAFRRIQLEAGPPVQVAIAIDAVEAGNGRWFGWLRNGSFEAASGWGNRVFDRLKPVRIGPPETILLSPGFQVDLGIGLFGFVLNVNGIARLKAVRTSAAGPSTLFETDLAPQGVRNVRWNYSAESGIAIFWQDTQGLVHRRFLDLQGKPRDTAAVLTSGVAPLTWDVPPLGNPVLLTVVRMPDGRYFFRDLGAGGPETTASRVPPAQLTELAEGMPPQPVFAFCPTAAATKIVMAGAGKIWSSSAGPNGPSAWEPVGDANQPMYLNAFSPRGRTCWVEWFEKDVGLRRARLP